MKRLPYWAQGGIFGFFLIPLIFFLKITCPLYSGCLVDPFLVPLFSPLFLLEAFLGPDYASIKGEVMFITLFWALVASLVAHLFGNLMKKQMGEEGEEEVT